VYKDGNNVYAKDENGNVICQNSPTACLQESINYLYQRSGGRILIKAGTYYPATTVNIPDGIKLIVEGEGDSTIFRYTDSFTLFLHRPNNPTWTSVLSFRNFKVDRSGSGANRANIIYVLYALYDEYDNITIVDDYRDVEEDVGLYGRNSIVSIVRNCRFFNKSSPVWFHSFLVHIYGNYARNTARIGFAAGHLLPESVFGYKQPPGYPLDGLVVIEDNVCIDCGRSDEAYAVDNEYNNPYTYGTGIIRNNTLITNDYTVHYAFVCGYVDRCIIENNTFIGSFSKLLIYDAFYRERPNLIIVRNNYIKTTLVDTPEDSKIILLNVGKIIIENNYIDINAVTNTNITYPVAMQYANYVVYKNNYFSLTLPSGFRSSYGITIEDLGTGSRDLELVVVENNNIKVSEGRPLTISLWGEYETPPLVKVVGNRLYSGSSTDIFLGLRNNNIVKATVLGNALEGGVSGLWLYADPTLTPTLIFLERDMLILPYSSQNIAIKYAVRNSGVATFNGDGTTTQFKIAHRLISTPKKVLVTPASANATGQFYVTADDTYIYVNYLTPPPADTNNVVLYWYAEV
jgi:hypothetical protein